MYTVDEIPPNEWIKNFSELAHFSVFGELRPKDVERISFALLVKKDKDVHGYVQCIEMDSQTLYWQLGGAIETKSKLHIVPCYMALIKWSLDRYARITTRIENTNISMLHLAMKMGFLVVGTWNFNNKIYLELLNEVKDGNRSI